jgi:hypothetical protein
MPSVLPSMLSCSSAHETPARTKSDTIRNSELHPAWGRVTCSKSGVGRKEGGKGWDRLIGWAQHLDMKLRCAIPWGLCLWLCGGPALEGPLLAQAEWELRSSGTGRPLNGVAFGNGRYVVAGDQGTVLVSTDGLSWRPEDAGSEWWLGAGFGNGSFLVVGTAGALATSSDTIGWLERESTTTNWLYDVTWGLGTFVAVGDEGTLLTSMDSVSWTNRMSGTSNRLDAVTAGPDQLVAVGFAGTVVTSTNGLSWSLAERVTERWLHDVTYGDGLYVAVGELGTVLISTNGTHWEVQFSGTSRHLFAVGVDESGFVAVGQGGLILRSSDGTAWRTSASGTTVWLFAVATGEETVVVGDAGVILTPRREVGEFLLLTNPRWLPEEGFEFSIQGIVPGQRVTVERSVDLETWEELRDFIVVTAPAVFLDESVVELGRHFYRARSP